MAGKDFTAPPDTVGGNEDSRMKLECRIVAHNCRSDWYAFDKDVDADRTHLDGLVTEIVDKFPPSYGDVVRVFYWCLDTKVNIEVSTDQQLLEMFAKHKDSKCCFMTLSYHNPNEEPPSIPSWDCGSSLPSVEPPITPAMSCPSFVEPSQSTQHAPIVSDENVLANPEPQNEHVGIDDEALYIDIGPKQPPPAHSVDDSSDDESYYESDDEPLSYDETLAKDNDEMVEDRAPEPMPDQFYDKKNPPMEVGTLYSNMAAYKIALASHCVKTEHHYDIVKADPGRYIVKCVFWNDGCPWRIHASTLPDKVTVQIKTNPNTHECQSKKREGVCIGVTQFWVCHAVVDWLKEDGNLKIKELRRRLKAEWGVEVPYRRVYKGKNLAMDQIYGPWDKSFNNLFRLKAQLEVSSPGSVLVIDHHTVSNKIRFNRLFFAMKPCVDGFLRGCRPYLAVDSTFLTGRFRGQLCIACAVDGHNWMYPVAVGVIDSETNENWIWFMERLKETIGWPEGLCFSTDCGQAVMNGVSEVFPGAEHRECMYHLVQNFKKRYSGKVFDDHLWAASYSWSPYMFDKHYTEMAAAKAEAMKYLTETHKKLWSRSQYRTGSKVDYVTNNLAESFNNWIKVEKGKNLDDLLDTIRQKILIKWNQRKRVVNQFKGKILPHIVQKLREDSYNLDIEVITASPDGVAELCAKGADIDAYRFVVDLPARTCTCCKWQGTGIPCKHAIAFITSLPGAKLEDYVDEFYSVRKFRQAYEGSIPCIPDKSMWPTANHGFFMHPPLLKSTGGGRHKNRMKSAMEGGTSKKGRSHQCQICKQRGHHWYTCKNGNPEDIAAMMAERGPPKKRQKKLVPATTSINTETSLVLAPCVMQYPHIPEVLNATVKKRQRRSSSTSKSKHNKEPASAAAASNRSGTGSNDPVPLQTILLQPPPEDSAATIQTPPRRKTAVQKKLTPIRLLTAATPSTPESPASNTRSKKKLQVD